MIALLAAVPLFLSLTGMQKPGASKPDVPKKPWEATDVPEPEEILVGGDGNLRYLLHGPEKNAKEPTEGWRVLVVMPGGDGSADFAPFVGRIRQNALTKEWILAQLVAPQWDEKQAEKTVWPTEKNPYPGMKFSTEKMLDSVLDDLGTKRKLDPKFVFTLSWSSGGPAAYALALEPKSRITGSLVAMSVFHKNDLPPLKNGSGRRFFILHSPEDAICPIQSAERARDELAKAGALVEFRTYEGGHGWHGDVYGSIRTGIEWLASGAKPEKAARGKPAR